MKIFMRKAPVSHQTLKDFLVVMHQQVMSRIYWAKPNTEGMVASALMANATTHADVFLDKDCNVVQESEKVATLHLTIQYQLKIDELENNKD